MSWRDRIDPELRGSYRGADFYVERSDTTGGRRWLIHEYPRRDRPYSEDMGRRAREWRLSVFVAGDDYDRDRDALIEALDAPGAASLVHPYLGTVSAVASDVRWSESTRDGGVCSFQITFSESGEEQFPATRVDTRLNLYSAADTFESSMIEDFAKRWSIEGLTGWSLTSVIRDLGAIMNGLSASVGDLTTPLTAAIRAPASILDVVLGGYGRIRSSIMQPLRGLDLYSGRSALSSLSSTGAAQNSRFASAPGMTATPGRAPRLGSSRSNSAPALSFSSGVVSAPGSVRLPTGTPRRAVRLLLGAVESGDSVAVPVADTPESRVRARNITAARRLNGRAAVLTAARAMADTGWQIRGDAEAAAADTLSMIDNELATAEPIADSVYIALTELRAAVATDIRSRATALPGMTRYTPPTTLPAVVVAHRLYGDAGRADEINTRNGVRHPGGLHGGIALEVLSV